MVDRQQSAFSGVVWTPRSDPDAHKAGAPDDGVSYCEACNWFWPCPTKRALEAVDRAFFGTYTMSHVGHGNTMRVLDLIRDDMRRIVAAAAAVNP